MRPSRKKVAALERIFDGLVLDESHTVKSKSKLPFRLCRRLSKSARVVFALTGTPHGRDPTDLWGQMMIVDHGETLGETLGLFRAAFFSETQSFFGHSAKFKFHKHKTKLLHRILNNNSIRFEANEADLPKVAEIIKQFSLPEDAEVYYQRARNTILKAGNYREMKNAWLRLRQISSGFVGYHDDDAGKTAEFEFPDNPKLDLLLSLLDGINEKAIVFHEYTYSGLRIGRELKRLGIPSLHLYGGSKDQQAILRSFNSDPSQRVLLLQNQFGLGLNLQTAKYGIFYESPVSPIVRKQCRRRFERQESAHKNVFQYDLVCRNSVDEKILAFLREGEDLLKAIIDGKAKGLI